MTVRITDLKSSILLQIKNQTPIYSLGWAIDENVKWIWVGRIHRHTTEELAEGHRQNPNLVTMPIEDFCEILGIEVPVEEAGKTVVCWPQRNGLSLFTSISFPAYEEGTAGIEGTFTDISTT